MPPLSLQDFAVSDTNYVEKHNDNNAALEAAVNALQAQILAAVGEGADLVLDVFDRDGLVGIHSYVLDLDAYPGGAEIVIGRRPAPVPAFGEVDESIAWGTYAGEKSRVRLVGDVTLDALPITSGLPKTIYVGIPSDGTPQLFESAVTPNVLYAYSMVWDGFQLSDFKRMAPILPHYTTLQGIAGAPRLLYLFDSETDWVSDEEGSTEIVCPGAKDDNEIEVDGALEVIGLFAHATKSGDDGFSAPAGVPQVSKVIFRVLSDGVAWNLDDFEFDASNIPDVFFSKVNVSLVGDDRFVTEVKRFSLERVSIGSHVVSARAFSWGLIVRPVVGIAIPKDQNKVILI